MKGICKQLVTLLRPKYLQSIPRITLISKQYYGSAERPSRLVRSEKSWRKQFSITTGSPASLKPNDILSKIKEVQSSFDSEQYTDLLANTEKTVVILSTPSFSTWLENGPFIPNLLQTIFPATPDGTEVETILGVVDGLAPPNISDLDSDGITPTEGFGISIILSKPGEYQQERRLKQSSMDSRSNPTDSSSITVRVHDPTAVEPTKAVQKYSDITMPLANTTFRNGRTSTLFEVRWERSSPGSQFEQTRSSELESLTISDMFSGKLFESSTSVPLEPITETRHVASGLGNIVRTLTDASGKEMPASSELEASVVSYLSSRGLPEQTVGVWALVFPGEVYESDLGKWAKDYPIRVWDAIRHGASLHRVVSGGGGWGIKAGLLSLDPETQFGSGEARYDFSQPGSALDSDAEQTQALGQIAKPGSYIQFLIAHQQLDQLAGAILPLNKPEKLEPREVDCTTPSIVLGCIPSTIDDIPLPPLETSGDEARRELAVAYNQLSILSENGLYLRREDAEQTHMPAHFTRVDIPGGVIRGQTEAES
ncbi:hypothetical protein VC83_05034 [Pseudogymnoascus destructans]|uniref:FIST domain-containing protein n=2 Tax=Pseudogymnoascus destructans TaxID=655981 RepID=L8G2R5_PSED2|nr:uncharacterized protein VC83_05034 [Pseudogymnoascus destructans]ELR06276.1 hypothetical protein GMDG_02070 [Pseudogymnoascus destructans 20631-21]OAF58520.1 hypothetical protein VC83_05034 [Pseudogymnoascus destructans]